MPDSSIPAVLPTPTEKEVEGFVDLYRSKYGVELEPAEAGRMLAGLMRFLYLTGTDPQGGTEEQEPAHPTQLTARKGRQSRKKA